MNLNCLACQSLQRVDSERELYPNDKSNFSLCWTKGKVERSWSGNLGNPRPYNKMRKENGRVGTKRGKKGHHRVHTTSSIPFDSSAPRLVRSCGMRRDWSFEDLMQRRDGEV